MSNKKATIYHNPNCSKSRQTLALLEAEAVELTIVLYLETPPNAEEIKILAEQLELKPRDIIRISESEYKTLSLDDESLTDAELIQAIVETPKLLQRPIVVANGKARIGRPPEGVLEIL